MVFISGFAQSQPATKSKVKIGIEIIGSTSANSRRWFYQNGEDHIYTELRLNFRISKVTEVGVFVGHQYKSYIYFKIIPNREVPLFMHREYIPAGIYGRINITDIFSENWH